MPFKITILGSSSAIPTTKRSLTAHLINHDERFFLVDCGEGTQLQLRRYKIRFSRINHIFISHLHGDHVFGLFGLLSTFSLLGRKVPLHLYAHPNLEKLLQHHFNFFNEKLSFEIIYHPINSKVSELIYDDKKLTVTTIPLRHRVPCVGFLFKEKQKPNNIIKEKIQQYNLTIKDIIAIKEGADFITSDGQIIPNSELTIPAPPTRSYAYCTDTRVIEKNITLLENIDVLYHETTFLDEDKDLARATYHSSVSDVANLAKEAKIKKLVIGHFSTRYKNEIQFLEQAQKIFPDTILAEDGLTIEI